MDILEIYGLALVTPAAAPVSVAEAKRWCKVEQDQEDADFTTLIAAAHAYASDYTGRALGLATWRLTLDEFPEWAIELPRPPLVAVLTVAYDDEDGAAQTVAAADYRVNVDRTPGLVEPVVDGAWPDTAVQTGAVRITYTAGTAIPAQVLLALRLLIAYWHGNREGMGEPVAAADRLLDQAWPGYY